MSESVVRATSRPLRKASRPATIALEDESLEESEESTGSVKLETEKVYTLESES